MLSLETMLVLVSCVGAPLAVAPGNPEFSLRLSGPCEETLEGLPGSAYDDGTGGAPDFAGDSPGRTWSVLLTIGDHERSTATQRWTFGLGVEGAVRITDITTNGTVSCLTVKGPPCRRTGLSFDVTELTGPPHGEGPQIEENEGALSCVLLTSEGPGLSPGKTYVICKIRVFARFPENEGETAMGRVFFATRIGSEGIRSVPTVYSPLVNPVTVDKGNPVLRLEDCGVLFKAVTPVADFIRCDANNDGKNDIADAIWVLNELFAGGPASLCRAAADCNADGNTDLTDAVYAITYQFSGGPAPPAPFPECGSLDGLPPEDCPRGSTICP